MGHDGTIGTARHLGTMPVLVDVYIVVDLSFVKIFVGAGA